MFTTDAKRKIPPSYPASWGEIRHGEQTKRQLELAIAPLLQRAFGYVLVKLGSLSSEMSFKNCSIKQHVKLGPKDNSDIDIVAKSSQLPLQNNSVDAFVVIAELDFAMDPHQIVREINRSITSDGYVVIAGFNPFSLVGVSKYFSLSKTKPIHQGRFFTPGRIKDWLQLLDFDIVTSQYLSYSTEAAEASADNQSSLTRLRQHSIAWLKRYIPWFSSMYIIVAKKSEIPLSRVRPAWNIKPKFATRPATAAVYDGHRRKKAD